MTTVIKQTAVEWAREHGDPFDFTVQIGASPKNVVFGKAWHYDHPVEHVGRGVLVEEAKAIPNAHKAIYSLDEPGEPEISFWYCAGWHDEQNVMFLHEVSVGLLAGPERCYHLVRREAA